ncbi:MAG: hypothetical protein ABI068_05990 [Ktedonobacterales bacterium]
MMYSVKRRIFADFMGLAERKGMGLSIPLGYENDAPELATLKSGERVIMIEPDNLQPGGTVVSEDVGGQRYWYGLLESRAAIQVIDPDVLASEQQHHPTASGSQA